MQSNVPILLLEDNEIDAELVRRIFKKANIKNPIHVAKDGDKTLEILKADGGSKIRQPCVILIDINLPRMNVEFS